MVNEFNQEANLAKFRAGITPSGLTFNKAPELKFVEGPGPNAKACCKEAPVKGSVDNPWVARRPNSSMK